MSDRDLKRALQEADQTLGAQGVPPAVDARLRERLSQRSQPRRWLPVLALAGAALTAVIAVVSRPAAPELGFVVVKTSGALSSRPTDDGSVLIEAPPCTLRDEVLGAEVEVRAPARLTHLERGLRLYQGSLTLEVDPARARPAPYVVEVSGGRLIVLGTRFLVEERGKEGSVQLLRGELSFEDQDGQRTPVTQGETLRWPLPKAAPKEELPPATATVAELPPARPKRPKVAVVTPAPSPTAPTREEERRSVEALLGRLASLRTRGRYAEAAEALRTALTDPWSKGTRERLSFELGSIVSDHLGDRAAACREWDRHQAEFGDGRYAKEIEDARQRLRCAGERTLK
jgi:transmembrane sensor